MIYIYMMSSKMGPKTYVGSTNDMVKRKYVHKNNSKCTSGILIEEYGWDNIIFTVLEECTVEQRNECEQYWIDFVPNTVNTRNAFITEEQRKEYNKEYREANREAIKEYRKAYNKANRETICKQERARNERRKEYYQKYYAQKKACSLPPV